MNRMDRMFRLSESGTTVRVEVLAGIDRGRATKR
jgi:xanthine/uracil/vitamin C permease (AzgA family)